MASKGFHTSLAIYSLLCLSYLLGQTRAAGVDLGLCDPVHISCSCGSSGTVQVQIRACTWFYRWRPYCKACEPDIDEDALCSTYRHCQECSTTRGVGCTSCPPGRTGRQCNEVVEVQTPAPALHCDAYGNRYVPINGCRQFNQYNIAHSLTVPSGPHSCPLGTLFDTTPCVCNHATAVTCHVEGGGPLLCDVPSADSLPNGRVIGTDGTSLRYVCNEGFTLSGSSNNECQDGQWTNQVPSCVADARVNCLPPTLPVHAKITQSTVREDYSVGSVVRIECDLGYELRGSREIECQPDASWRIENDISCVQISSCEDPGTPMNAVRRIIEPRIGGSRRSYQPRRSRLLGSTYVSRRPLGGRRRTGRQARNPTARNADLPDGQYAPDTRFHFSCESRHYELIGSRYRACLPSGRWTGRQPACIPVCGRSGASRTAFITNGNATVRGQWPWQVAITRNDLHPEPTLVCGGALLSEHWIVTAGHCVTNQESGQIIQPSHFKIHLGRYYRDPSRADDFVQEFQVEEILIHDQFDHFSLDADIALVKLRGPGAIFSERVRPVCLSDSEGDSRDRLRPGNEGVVTGWGLTEDGTNAQDLKQASIPVIDSEICEESYLDRDLLVPVTGFMYCAGYEEGRYDACAGDSGGPMVFSEGNGDDRRWILEGLVSWGSPSGECGSPGEYGGYTRVSKFLDWINEIIGN